MHNFEYAQPATVADAVQKLNTPGATVAILAGGTDLVGLLKRSIITPDRVVNVTEIAELQQIERDHLGQTWVGAAVRLDDFLASKQTSVFPAANQVIQGISSIQLQSQGTVVGELLRRPMCWYFRDGHSLLADRGRKVVEGDNRYHAILGNRGAAKFVNASRLAPALIALGARVRVVGPDDNETVISLESLYRTPQAESESENCLEPGQLVTHLILPPDQGLLSAAYEVRHGEGPDQPLTSASVALQVERGTVQVARIVLGQVAPIPWIAQEAANSIVGRPLDEANATVAGHEATIGAMPLSHNEYKIQLAQVAAKRAIMRAAGLDVGDIRPCPPEPTNPIGIV